MIFWDRCFVFWGIDFGRAGPWGDNFWVGQKITFRSKILFLHSNEDDKEENNWTCCSAPKLSNILALLIKNWITMKRNPVLLIFIFFLPGIFMVLTCISIGIDPVDLPIGVVNYETNCTGVNLNVSRTCH